MNIINLTDFIVKSETLTLIGYPGDLFVRDILFFLRIRLSVNTRIISIKWGW